MPGVPFERTLRSLERDTPRPLQLGIGLAALGLTLWMLWLFYAPISVYAISQSARVEVQAAFPVEAQVRGSVVATHLVLGRPVKAGEVLVELDAEALRIAAREKRTLLENLTAQSAAIEGQLHAEEALLDERQRLVQRRLAEAEARTREAHALAAYADKEAARTEILVQERLESRSNYDRSRADAKARRALAEAARLAGARITAEGRVEESDTQRNVARLHRELETLRGQQATVTGEIESIEHQIERCRIRAPSAGHLAETANLQVGAVLESGQKVATILPEGRLTLVAEYAPEDAIGRIEPGQTAYLRLAGFPEIRYGTVAAVVARVAHETRQDRVRVELQVDPRSTSAVHLEHGMPGTIDIEIERVSPARLLLRTVTGWLQK
ncbi:MAG TPA: HlyD family efflux transporter periplasmic adaptor subunit [Polyangia bacterium]|nr:HlyD family efflux transporter periplasmic adaptor subunit [Polyangia bacterium]